MACQGVCHGDELALLYLPLALSSSGDRQMSRMMVDWWSNFAKHGQDQGKDRVNQNSRIRVALHSSHSRNPTPESGLWQEWGESEQYLKIGECSIFSLFNSYFQTTVHKWIFRMRWPPEWIFGRAFVVSRVADMVVASTEDILLLDSCKQFKFISNGRSVFFGILDQLLRLNHSVKLLYLCKRLEQTDLFPSPSDLCDLEQDAMYVP